MCVDGRRRRNLYPGIQTSVRAGASDAWNQYGHPWLSDRGRGAECRRGCKQLVEGNYTIEERMMLYGSAAYRNVRDVALNDIVMTRSGSMKIVHFNLYVNGEFLNSYDADGLIVSTPTGSTAYNLSAGGPIVEPTASLIVVTPICSHALNSRSIVFADKDEIVIEIGAKRENQIEEAVIAYDGADEVPLHTGDRIRIKKAWETAKIVKLSKVSFLETLREKMKGN